MCTVAFLPTAGGGYVLGHDRDERRTRSRGEPPRPGTRDGRRFLAPRDPDGGGTWLAVNDRGVTVSLLNAAEATARALPGTPRSRGLVLHDALAVAGIDALRSALGEDPARFRDTRAFRLVAAETGPRLLWMTWDGERVEWGEERERSLFVSSTYDPTPVTQARTASWERFLREEPDPTAADLERWLGSHEADRALSVCMHRPEALTVSRTMVEVEVGEARVRYTDGPPCDPGSTLHRSRIALIA